MESNNFFKKKCNMVVFEQGMKCAILEEPVYNYDESMTESCPRNVFGKPSTKSILKSCYGLSGIGRGIYNPVFFLVPLVI